MTEQWANRIIGYGEESPDQLLANPKNVRMHPRHQQEALSGVLREIGLVQNVIVNQRTGMLVDGHLRVELALRENQSAVPVTYVDLSEAEEALVLATLDPIAALATTDAQKLDELLREVSTGEAAVQQLLADMAEATGIIPELPPLPEAGAGGDEFDATPNDAPTRCEMGSMWLIGGVHRLLIGDCTKAEVMERLMAGDTAEMVFTDPPYGVAVGDKNKYLNAIGPSNRVERNLENDTLDEESLAQFLSAAFKNLYTSVADGGAWYVAAPPGPLHVVFGQALKSLGVWRQTIQWVKNNATFAPLGVDYHWRCEPIFYGWKPGAAHRYYGGRKQDTVWEIDRPLASPDHPTMKPIALVQRTIENSSQYGEIVLDAFFGSGTTLIAAHRTGRICYGMEIDPRYGDVIVRRAEAEGLTVERVESWPTSRHN